MERPNLAFSPYFCGRGRFDRIIEMGEQTGALREIFRNFLKMVPLLPPFFSYFCGGGFEGVKNIVLLRQK